MAMLNSSSVATNPNSKVEQGRHRVMDVLGLQVHSTVKGLVLVLHLLRKLPTLFIETSQIPDDAQDQDGTMSAAWTIVHTTKVDHSQNHSQNRVVDRRTRGKVRMLLTVLQCLRKSSEIVRIRDDRFQRVSRPKSNDMGGKDNQFYQQRENTRLWVTFYTMYSKDEEKGMR